jgi:hypothetical protein
MNLRNPPPVSRHKRGYGTRHYKLRKQLAPLVASGQAICSRCRLPILPGEPWDLGHVDGSKTEYAGPEHRRCNRATSRHRRQSREW